MKFFLISDNIDTSTGMRLAGIEGVVVHEAKEVEEALKKAIADESIGIILITEILSKLCSVKLTALKQSIKRPIIIEIPDRHGTGRSKDSITNYVQNAIGIKI